MMDKDIKELWKWYFSKKEPKPEFEIPEEIRRWVDRDIPLKIEVQIKNIDKK